MSNSIFLSHSHADKEFAHRLAQDLINAGVQVWTDDTEILVGDSLTETISAGIEKADFLGVILSPDSVNSEWVKREVEFALNEEIDGKRVKVLPLLYRQCELPGFLKVKKCVDFTNDENYDESLRQVLKRLGITSGNGDKKFASLPKIYPKNFPSTLIYFTGREQVLADIDEALKTHGTAAFADTHGVGKSSVVIEFAHRQQRNYQKILFIRATNNEFDIYVSEIVKELGFALPEDAKPEQRLEKLQDWLAQNQDWLLLIDNVDDVDFIHNCKFNKSNGKVIYTSNDERIFNVGAEVELPKMLVENASLLLYKHWKHKPNAKYEDIPENTRPALEEIAEKFGNHPFSMAFVGSYLNEEWENLEGFLAEYQSKEANLLEKYKFLSDYQYKDKKDNKASVAAAFLLRFEQISTPKDDTERERFLSTAVKDYLKLSAYVGTDNIPEELLQQSLAKLHPDQTEWTESKDFIKDIYKRFKPTSIFKRDAENKTLTTHRIVQEIMRFQIKDEEYILLETLAEVLAINFERFNLNNKIEGEVFLPHIENFLNHLQKSCENEQQIKNKNNDSTSKKPLKLSLENYFTAKLCDIYATYKYYRGSYEIAEQYFECAKNTYEGNKDIEQDIIANSYGNLAKIYYLQGKFLNAKSLLKKAIKIFKNKLGENRAETAKVYNDLGEIYLAEGEIYLAKQEAYLKEKEIYLAEEEGYLTKEKYKKAENFFLKAKKIREKIFSENILDTAITYNDLGILYDDLARLNDNPKEYKKSEQYHLKAKQIFESCLGLEHQWTVMSYSNLGRLYSNKEDYEKAKPLYIKVKDIREKILDENHPELGQIYYNLGTLYFKINNIEESLKFSEKALKVFQDSLPTEHPYIQMAKQNVEKIKNSLSEKSKIETKNEK
jgi:tetratricopeptide (TPR) repeat protein